jgi:hypothetical protein
MVRLPIPLPPTWPEALGYDGEARYLALHWTGGAAGGHVWIDDGTTGAQAPHWPAFLLVVREHRLGRAIMDPYDLGLAREEPHRPEHRLLVDRWEHTIDVGLERDVAQFLATQPSAVGLALRELGPNQVIALHRQAQLARALSDPAEVMAQVRRQQQRMDTIAQWLEELLAEIEDHQ